VALRADPEKAYSTTWEERAMNPITPNSEVTPELALIGISGDSYPGTAPFFPSIRFGDDYEDYEDDDFEEEEDFDDLDNDDLEDDDDFDDDFDDDSDDLDDDDLDEEDEDFDYEDDVDFDEFDE
jgi:hypothetical protein